MFYRSKCCDGANTHALSAEDYPKINKATIEALLKKIHSKTPVDKKQLLNETKSIFSGAVTKGYTKTLNKVAFNSPDFIMLNELHYNVGVFAAFKNHDQITELVKLLKDNEGKLRAWSEFKTAALKLNEKYNTRWLKVEYDQALTSARAARRWQDFQRTKHIYPNLEYIAINDDRTRALHKKWHGIVLPIDHVFWRTHYTPNDYGCRCIVRRTSKPVNTKGYNVEDMPDLPPQFNQNVGLTGKVYSNEHPYYKTTNYKQVATFAKNALVRWQTQTYFKQLKNTFKKPIKTQIGKVTILNKGIKEALSQPHKNAYLKNNLLLKLDDILNKAYYIKSSDPKRLTDYYKKYHYLRIENFNDMVIVLREDPKGKLFFYSIVDQIK